MGAPPEGGVIGGPEGGGFGKCRPDPYASVVSKPVLYIEPAILHSVPPGTSCYGAKCGRIEGCYDTT